MQRPGTGLGLTIAKMLTDLMGGELTVSPARRVQGSVFRVKLFLPEVRPARYSPAPAAAACSGPRGLRRRRAAASWWWTTKRPTANCWCACWSPGL
jgi:hypothetical protein